MARNVFIGLENIEESGAVPETRMEDALDVCSRVTQFREADRAGRSRKRSLWRGLVEGNPPYRPGDLERVGRKDACNVNWRIAESMFTTAVGAFYDVFSEVPIYAKIEFESQNTQDAEKWGRIVSEEFHLLLMGDKSWDYNMQLSQYEMVLHGAGPMLFEDHKSWRTCAALYQDFLVPDNATADVTTWEEAARIVALNPHQLYYYIRDPKIASAAGWNVPAVRRAIMRANKATRSGGRYRNWEWHQTRLKIGSFEYTADSDEIEVAHYFFREFPHKGDDEGEITHCIVLSEEADEQSDFLFRKVRRFKQWENIVHPLYYDNSGGGKHYGVTGMGSRMYSAMEYQNRLLCKLAEDSFAPKILFKPTTANAEQVLSVSRLGPWGKVSPGFDVQQMPIAGLIEEGIAFNRELTGIIGANLAQFRSNITKTDGNPITATEAEYRASDQARLGKTQLNRYYTQLDWLYAEKYARAVSADITSTDKGGAAAKAFQDKCVKRGVPLGVMRKPISVTASRVAGQGSQILRRQVLERILGIVGMLPEGGQKFLIEDFIAALAGQHAVQRYAPQIADRPTPDHVIAALQLASMKDGVNPVITDDQDSKVFAITFLEGASAAAQSVQQTGGQNAQEVLAFLNIAGPAILVHIQRLARDPRRKELVAMLMKQFGALAKFTDQLKAQVMKAADAQNEGNGKLQQAMSDDAIKAATMQRDQQRKDQQLQADISRKERKLAVDIQAKTAKTVQAIESSQMKDNMRAPSNAKED